MSPSRSVTSEGIGTGQCGVASGEQQPKSAGSRKKATGKLFLNTGLLVSMIRSASDACVSSFPFSRASRNVPYTQMALWNFSSALPLSGSAGLAGPHRQHSSDGGREIGGAPSCSHTIYTCGVYVAFRCRVRKRRDSVGDLRLAAARAQHSARHIHHVLSTLAVTSAMSSNIPVLADHVRHVRTCGRRCYRTAQRAGCSDIRPYFVELQLHMCINSLSILVRRSCSSPQIISIISTIESRSKQLTDLCSTPDLHLAMPFYEKDVLAAFMTDLHSTTFVTPKFFVTVRFEQVQPAGDLYSAAKYRGNMSPNHVLVTARVSPARTKQVFDEMALKINTKWNDVVNDAALGAQSLDHLPAKQQKQAKNLKIVAFRPVLAALENGVVIPEPGHEKAWIKDNMAYFQQQADQYDDDDFKEMVEEIKERGLYTAA
nr:hypothetical protein CFP56_52214 [Quercus suber]